MAVHCLIGAYMGPFKMRWMTNKRVHLIIPVSLDQLVGILHIICMSWGSNPDTSLLNNEIV